MAKWRKLKKCLRNFHTFKVAGEIFLTAKIFQSTVVMLAWWATYIQNVLSVKSSRKVIFIVIYVAAKSSKQAESPDK